MKKHLIVGILMSVSLLISSAAFALEVHGENAVSGGNHYSVTYTGAGKPYGITAHAANCWEFRDKTHITNTLNWYADPGTHNKNRWGKTKSGSGSSDINNELFSVRISGKIVPVCPGDGSPPPTDWSVRGTFDGDFKITPGSLTIGIKKLGTFDTEHGSASTTWEIRPYNETGGALSTHPTGESITIGFGEGTDILVPAGKWTVEATEGSDSDTAILTVVKTEKIVVAGTNDEGPVLVLEKDSEDLEAIPYPEGESFPEGCPDWAINTKPSGSSLADPADGNKTATITPDKVGKYKILADFATFDLYAYKFGFERIPGGHGAGGGSIEGTSATNGYQEGLLGTYGEITSNDHNPKTGTFTLNEFGMKAEGVKYATDEGIGSVLYPSGERLLEVYLNVGNANITLDVESNTTVQGTISHHNAGVRRGGGIKVLLDEQETTYDYYILNGQFVENPLENPKLIITDQNYTGKTKIGSIRADVNYESEINVKVETKVNVDYKVKLKGN